MAIYEVPAPNGKTYKVEAPQGTPAETIQRMAFQQYRRDEQANRMAMAFREDPGFFDNMLGGIGAGAVSGTATALEGASSLLSDEGESKAREIIAKGRDALMPTNVDPESWNYKISSGIGSMIPLLGAAMIPGIGLPAAGAVGVSMGAGEARNRAMEAGVTGDELGSVTAKGALVGSLEVLPLTRMLKVLRVPAPAALENMLTPKQTEGIRQWLIERAKTGGFEAAQEGAANVLQNLIAQGYNPEQETFEGTAEEATIGGIAGAIVDALIPGRARGAQEPPPAPDEGAPVEGAPVEGTPVEMSLEQQAAERRKERQAGVLGREEQRQRDAIDRTAEDRARAAESRVLAGQLGESNLDMFPAELREILESSVTQEPSPEPKITAAQRQQLKREAKAREDLERRPPEQLTIDEQIARDEDAELEQMQRDETLARDAAEAAERDAAETRQIEEMVAADESAAQQAALEQQELETASAAETLTRQRDFERERGYEGRRRAILDDLISDPTFPTLTEESLATVATERLSQAGFGRPQPTEQEMQSLLRAKQIAEAERPTPEPLPEDPDAAQNAQMEAAIPELTQTPRQPEQPPLPGIEGRGMAERRGLRVPEEAPEPSAPPPIIDDNYLDNLNIKRGAMVRNRLLGKNLANEGDRGYVLGQLENLKEILQRQSPEAASLPAVQREIDYLNSLDATAYDGDVQQGEMFGPRGGINPQARVKTPKRKQQPAEPAPAEEVSEATETEVAEAPPTNEAAEEQVAEQQNDEVTDDAVSETNEPEQAGAGGGPRRRARSVERQPADQVGDTPAAAADTGRSGLASNQPDDADAGVREGTDGGSLTEAEPKAEPKPAAKKEAPKKAKKEKTQEQVDYEDDMAAARSRVSVADLQLTQSWSYTETIPDDPSTKSDYRKLLDSFVTNVRSKVASAVESMSKSVLSKSDRVKIINSLSEVESAYSYFSRRSRPIDAIRDMVHDSVFETEMLGDQDRTTAGDRKAGATPKESIAYRRFSALANKKTADKAIAWVRKNMSSAVNAQLDKMIAKESAWAIRLSEDARLAESMEKLNPILAGETNVRAKLEEAKNGPLNSEVTNLTVDEIEALTIDDVSDLINFSKNDAAAELIPLPTGVDALLEQGDIRGALRAIGSSNPNRMVRAIANRLAKALPDNVQIVVAKPNSDWGKFLKKEKADGFYTEGAKKGVAVSETTYIPVDKPTIVLSAETGMHTHALLHEAAHAILKANLKRPNLPVVKRLQGLFDQVKKQLPTAYGSKDLDEFTSEYLSNTKFRQTVAQMTDTKGESFLPRIAKAFRDILARALGYENWNDRNIQKMLDRVAATSPKVVDDSSVIQTPDPYAGGSFLITQDGDSRGIRQRVVDYWSPENKFAEKQRKERAEQVIDFAKTKPVEFGKAGVLKFLQFQSIVDVSRDSGIYTTQKIYDALDKINGKVTEVNNRLNATYNAINKAFQGKDRLDKITEYSEFENAATLLQVDPTIPQSQAVFKYEGDQERLDEWARLREQWVEWGKNKPEMQEVWHKLRKTYGDLFDDLKDSLLGKIDASVEDKAVRALLKDKISQELLNNSAIEPYAPLHRKGDYWLEYHIMEKPKSGSQLKVEQMYVTAFETAEARRVFIEDLKANSDVLQDSIYPFPKDRTPRWEKAPPGSFVNSIIKELEKAEFKTSVDKQEAIYQIVELYTEALPESSFARSLKKRKGDPGFMNDALQVFQDRAFGMARQIQRMRSSSQLYALHDEFKSEIKEWGAKSASALVKDPKAKRNADGRPYINESMRKALESEVGEAVNFAVNPPSDWMSRLAPQLNRFAYMGTLGFNVSSAALQLFQIPMVAYPHMAPKTNMTTAYRAMKAGTKFFSGAGREHKILQYGSDSEYETVTSLMPSIDNYYVVDKDGNWSLKDDIAGADDVMFDGMTRRELAQELIPLIKEASERGMMNRSLLYESMGLEDGGRGSSFWDRFSSAAAGMHHTAERFNRQALMVGMYLNESVRIKNNPTAAERAMSDAEKKAHIAKIALYDTIQTNGGAALQVAPSISKKGLLRVAMMFKPYGMQMYYHQFKMAKEAMKRWDKNATAEEKELSKIAFQQLVGTQGAVALLSGVQGLTLYGIVAGVANLFLGEDEPDFETLTREALGEGPWKGLINYATGTDMAARIGLSNMILQGNKYNFDPSMEKSLVATLGGPFYGYFSQILRGGADVLGGEVQRGVENILPAAFRNVARTARYIEEDGIRTRRGDLITGDLGPANLAGQLIGFAPAEYTRQMELNMVRKRIDRTVGEKRTNLLRQYYVALRMGDYDGAQDVMSDIAAFNKKWASYAITPETVKRSMAQHQETSATGMFGGITISPELRAQLLQLGNDAVW